MARYRRKWCCVSDTIYQGGTGRIVANRVNLNSKDNSILRISTTSGYSLQGTRRPYQALTLSRLLDVSESGKTISNDGAGSFIALTLPDTTEYGVEYKFVRVSSFDIRVTPQGGSSIKYSGGTMTAGEYIALSSDGAKLHLMSDGNGDWIATYEFGSLTEETP